MAISRVGGTKGLASGSVGNETYYIVKDSNGKYVQQVQAKQHSRVDTKTLLLATQRMITASVEAMMKSLKPIAKYAFQSAKNKTQSVNAFSGHNIRLLTASCKAFWYEDSQFYFNAAGEPLAVAGPFYISSGSLPYDVFKRVWSYTDYWRSLPDAQKPTGQGFYNGVCVTFDVPANAKTLADFMTANRLTFSSQVMMAGFWEHVDEEIDKTSVGYKHAIVTINPRQKDSALLTEDSLKSLFLVTATDPVTIVYNPLARQVVVGSMFQDPSLEYTIISVGAFTRDYRMGRLMISSHHFEATGSSSFPYILGAYPARILYSYMDMPQSWIAPYPWQ